MQVSLIEKSLDFSKALIDVKRGLRIYRDSWNSDNDFVVSQKGYPEGIKCNKQTAEAWDINEGDLFVCNPYLQKQNADGSHSMWVPTIDDILAGDWVSALVARN